MMVREFFMDLYCAENNCSLFPLSGCFPELSQADLNFTHRSISKDEIKNTLFAMGSLKALG